MRFAYAWLHVARKTKRYDDWDPPYEPVCMVRALWGTRRSMTEPALQGGNGVTPERNGVTSDARLYVARKTNHPMSPMTPMVRAA
jgi:hypothetical protein